MAGVVVVRETFPGHMQRITNQESVQGREFQLQSKKTNALRTFGKEAGRSEKLYGTTYL